MMTRYTNGAILALIAILTVSGVYGLVWLLPAWMYDLHRVAGYALIAMIPWKGLISIRSLSRRLGRGWNRGVGVVISLGLVGVTLLVIAFGLLWSWGLGPEKLSLFGWVDSVISWHWMFGLTLLPAFALHAWRRWPRPRAADFLQRRGALRSIGLGAAGWLGWRLAEGSIQSVAVSAAGSREEGSYSGNDFPVTNSPGAGRERIEGDDWRLSISGEVGHPLALSYEQLLRLPHTSVEATLDCTVGWYSTQIWSGVSLDDLLALVEVGSAAKSLKLISHGGKSHSFAKHMAPEILLATHVGGERINHWHGFPLRAVVPWRRGWFWLKWLVAIQASRTPALL